MNAREAPIVPDEPSEVRLDRPLFDDFGSAPSFLSQRLDDGLDQARHAGCSEPGSHL